MPTQKPTAPAASSRSIKRQLGDDPAQAHKALSEAVGALEDKVGQVQKLITKDPPVVSGSKGGNAALASLISALDGLGLVKDQTT